QSLLAIELAGKELTLLGGPEKTEWLLAFSKAKMGATHPARRQDLKPIIPVVLGQAHDLTGDRNLTDLPGPVHVAWGARDNGPRLEPRKKFFPFQSVHKSVLSQLKVEKTRAKPFCHWRQASALERERPSWAS